MREAVLDGLDSILMDNQASLIHLILLSLTDDIQSSSVL